MKILYDIIHILPLSALLVSFFGGLAGMPSGSLLGYIVCLAVPLWIIILRHISKKNRLRSIGIVAVLLIVLVIIAGDEGRRVLITEYSWLGWIVIISVFAVAAGIFTEKNIWVKRAVSAALLGYSIAGIIAEWDIAKTTFALTCFVVLVHLAEEIQRKWKKDGNAAKKEHLTRISPIILALCLGVLALPADVSDGKSYLDYFLLTSRKGFCMHYATAFVLMAREMGVPCRYVHGYSVGTNGAENVTVTQNNAHAWAEVYFDNVGWIAFEPTPGYSNGSSWKPLGNTGSLPQYDGSNYMPVIDKRSAQRRALFYT